MSFSRIEQFRKAEGISQKELAELAGVPLGTLTKIISGETKDPKFNTVKAIARALHKKVDDLDDETANDYYEEKPQFSIPLSDADIRIINEFMKLSERDKHKIEGRIENYIEEQILETEREKRDKSTEFAIETA